MGMLPKLQSLLVQIVIKFCGDLPIVSSQGDISWIGAAFVPQVWNLEKTNLEQCCAKVFYSKIDGKLRSPLVWNMRWGCWDSLEEWGKIFNYVWDLPIHPKFSLFFMEYLAPFSPNWGESGLG